MTQLQAHRGTLILVLGILGIVICGPCGIAAWVMGNGDLVKMDSGIMDPEGRGMTKAGKILGIVATVLMVLTLIWILVVFVFVGAAAMEQ